MTSMRERIARAMCGPSWDAKNFNETPDGSSPEENRGYYLHMADTALDALMEPTEGMILTQGKSRPDLAKTDRQREATIKVNDAIRRMAKETFVEMILAAKEGL